jgi:hypothetical protein
MDNIRISVDLTTDDWRALQRAFLERRRKLKPSVSTQPIACQGRHPPNSSFLRPLLVFALMSLAFGFCHQSIAQVRGKIYAVIFDVTVDSSGKIDTMKVDKVIDPSKHSTDAVDVVVPSAFLSAARTFLSRRVYDTNPSHFSTYLFFDPQRPTKADIDPRNDQP